MIRPDQWLPAADMDLEPNALTAATATDRNLVVTAGPGAGKTELLAQRADFLLRTGICRYPRRVLAISFKVDAAKNLKNRVRRRCPPELAARLDSYTFHAFAKRLIDTFRPVLTGQDELDPDYTVVSSGRVFRRQIDFDAMAPLATTILENSPIARAALTQTYGYVFLDEFQDCTTNQYGLLRAAFHDTNVQLIAVGDVKQRIMRFAGALDGVLARFAEDFAAQPLILYLNFRAQPRLRRMQNAMIRVMEPAAAIDDATLVGDDGVIEVQRYRDTAHEAQDLAERIAAWIADGVPPDEIAVLVGKQIEPYTETLREELRARGIAFRQENELQDLAAEPAAVLITDFLAVAVGQREPDAYTRLIDVALGWLGDDDPDQLRYMQLRRTIDQARRDYRANQHGTLRALVDRFLGFLGTDVIAGLAPQYQQGTRLAEVIEAVLARLEQFQTETGDMEQAVHAFLGRDAVKLMTIHKAKGLEFDVVVVLAIENEMYWGDDDDERAAYFVAVSRARKVLCLTVCEQRPRPTTAPSRWNVQRTPHEEFLSYALAAR